MNGEDQNINAAATMTSGGRSLVPDDEENPLWAGSTDDNTEVDRFGGATMQCSVDASYVGGQLCATPFPIGGEVRAARAAVESSSAAASVSTGNRMLMMEPNYQQQSAMMSSYMEKFASPPCTPLSVGSGVASYYVGGAARRVPSLLPEVDLSHRPGSLQEAICMYIDFLMAENEIRTRISECAVASPPPPLDFHLEEYYRDVMCRPVNFPTARFRDWLKRYNVDIEITDPDGQTVSQTTFAPTSPVTANPEPAHPHPPPPPGVVVCETPTVSQRRRQRSSVPRSSGVIHHSGGGGAEGGAGGGAGTAHIDDPSGHPFLMQRHPETRGSPVEMLDVEGQAPSGQPAMSLYGPSAPYAADGRGYGGSIPVEETKAEQMGLGVSGLALSGWPDDANVEQPESGSSTVREYCGFAEGRNLINPLTTSSADPYIQERGDEQPAGKLDSEIAADRASWLAARIIPNPNIRPLSLNQIRGGPNADSSEHHFVNLVAAENQDGGAVNGRPFPVVIEPASLSDSGFAAKAGDAQQFQECFTSDGSAEYQLPCETGSDQELYGGGGTGSDATQLGEAKTGTATPPSQSTDATACLELGCFADLLGSQHSHEFEYHLNYGGDGATMTCDEASEHLSEDVVPDGRVGAEKRRRMNAQRRAVKPAPMSTAALHTSAAGRPACKSATQHDVSPAHR